MSTINIKIISQSDWKVYKHLRLQSLMDSPDSFGSTFERESKIPNKEWSARLCYQNKPEEGFLIVAEQHGAAVGLACGLIHSETDQKGYVYQMWVSPNARNKSIGKLLLECIINWARDKELQELSLAVTTTNVAALNLYRSSGFCFVGKLEDLRPGSELKVQPMTLNLRTNHHA